MDSFRRAIQQLSGFSEVVGISQLYLSKSVGGPPQPDYLNAAARIRSRLSPHELLDQIHGIERSLGRQRLQRWGPRSIDLDILWIRGVVLETVSLVIPHPRLMERQFALLPLLDVAPEAIDPVSGLAYRPRIPSGGKARVVRQHWLDEPVGNLGNS